MQQDLKRCVTTIKTTEPSVSVLELGREIGVSTIELTLGAKKDDDNENYPHGELEASRSQWEEHRQKNAGYK